MIQMNHKLTAMREGWESFRLDIGFNSRVNPFHLFNFFDFIGGGFKTNFLLHELLCQNWAFIRKRTLSYRIRHFQSYNLMFCAAGDFFTVKRVEFALDRWIWASRNPVSSIFDLVDRFFSLRKTKIHELLGQIEGF